jgi:lipopolysaccharide export system protein LptA
VNLSKNHLSTKNNTFARVMKKINTLFCIFISFNLSSLLIAQVANESAQQDKYITVSGQQKMIYDQKKGANRLLGGVTCTHRNTTMTCDSAWLYDNNTLEAFGHVFLRQGDSLTINGDHLNYDGEKRIGLIDGNVFCREKDMILTTKALVYDMKTAIASYASGGSIQNKGNTLTSKRGYYHSPSKTLSFRYDVKLYNPKFNMVCDTLRYNINSKIAIFDGPSTIFSDSNVIYTEKGWYNTTNENCQLFKNPKITSGRQILKGDTMFYERKKNYGIILGHVVIKDTTDSMTITGKKAEHWQSGGLSIVSGKPICYKFFKKDTLFIWADTFYTWSDPKGPEKILRAWYRCNFYKKDFQGKCDSMSYKTSDSTMTLYRNPVLWNDKNQLTAKLIKVKTGKKSIKSFSLLDNAFVISKKDTISFDQIKGKTIDGFFTGDSLRKIFVKGNSQALYFIEQNKKVSAINRTDCSEMTINLNSKGIEGITFIKKPVASIKPLKLLKPAEMKLKGFVWLWEEKPVPPQKSEN